MKIFIHTESLPEWLTREWSEISRRISPIQGDAIVDTSAEADVILVPKDLSLREGRELRRTYAGKFLMAWSDSDAPRCILPGLYCSLAHGIADLRRHASFSYPLIHNEMVDICDLNDAHVLWSFHGGMTAPVRRRIVEALSASPWRNDGKIIEQIGPWSSIYIRSDSPEKKGYVDTLRSTKFMICPRGNGFGSVRLFETMKAQRVPVIVADRYVLPRGVAWSDCAILVPESELHTIPERCREAEPRWRQMAANARSAWERLYSDGALLRNMADHAREFQKSRTTTLCYASYARATALYGFKRAITRVIVRLERLGIQIS